MILRAVKNKLKVSIIFMLLFCMLVQNVTPAFANDNGNNTSTDSSASLHRNYLTSVKQNLAVFLYDGDIREFILDRDELTATVKGGKGTGKTVEYVKEQNDNYLDMSVSKAYAQIFKRTQVAWEAVGVAPTLILMGPDNYWKSEELEDNTKTKSGPGGGITTKAGLGSLSDSVYRDHAMFYEDENQKFRNYEHLDSDGNPMKESLGSRLYLGRYEWPNEVKTYAFPYLKWGWLDKSDTEFKAKWGHTTYWDDLLDWGKAPYGEGMFKSEILAYVKDYFDNEGKVSKTPDEFFSSLVANPSSSNLKKAYHIWAYISAGADVRADGIEEEGPINRWRNIFESSNRLSADEVFIGHDGLYELKNGKEEKLDALSDPRVFDQFAAYLDTLLSLNLVTKLNNKGGIGEYYLTAAVEGFGKPGAYITKPMDYVQPKSIVFDTWSTECYSNIGQSTKGTVVTYTDNWAKYRKAFHSNNGVPVRDWRSTNPVYNDYKLTSVAENSTTFKKWTSEVAESTDRIGIRLSLLDPKKYPAKTKVNDSKIDISQYSVWMPALAGYGSVSSSLGRSASDTKNDTILKGLVGVYRASRDHNYAGLGSTKLDMVGGQSVLFTYIQGSKPPEVFPSVQRISATPNSKLVDPNPLGLNKDIIVSYKVGNKVVPESKTTTYRTVGYDKKLLDSTINTLTDLKTKYDAKLYVRTYITREVTNYKLNTLWLSGSGKASPIKTSGIETDTVETDLPSDVEMALGNKIVSKASFATDKASSWSEISISDYKSLFTAKNCVMLADYKDEFYRPKQWSVTTQPTDYVVVNGAGNTKHIYYPGYDFYLKVMYRADTQFKVTKTVDGVKTTHTWDYTGKTGKSVANLSDIKKSPYILSYSTQTEDYSPTANSASFKYKKDAESFEVANELVKENIPYGVYSSSPEAYAELKNWGVSTTNEPHDSTGLGNNRSPMDTQLNVSSTTKSNGSSVITEDYEAMSGVPTTEKLYLAIGGSEFIVDIAVQYVPNETAVRSYTTHFDGVPSQFNYASPSGAGGDTPDDTVWGSHAVPQPKGLTSGVTAQVTTSKGGGSINPHDGGTYTLTINGTIHNDGVDGKLVISDHDGGTYPYNYGNGRGSDSNFALRAPASAQGSNGSGSQLTASEAAKGNGMPLVGSDTVTRVPNTTHDSPKSWAWAVPRVSDVKAFNDSMDTTVKQWIDDMVNYFKTSPGFKAGSDLVTRRFGDGEVGNFTYTKDLLDNNIRGYEVYTPDKGRLDVVAPAKLFHFTGDKVAGDTFNIVAFKTNDVYEATNPSNKSATATSSNNGTLRTISYEIQTKSAGTTYSIQTIPGAPAQLGPPPVPEGPDTYVQLSSGYSSSNSWSGSITGKWTDGYNIEWFGGTSEGQAEYNAFVAQYNAALAAANAWVAAENAKNAGTGSGGLKTGVGDVSASITNNKPVYTSTAFVADTGSGTATAIKDGDYPWSASYTFTVVPHTLCGPDCGHNLPEINDVWQQSLNYDYLKIIGLSVLRLDQGAASDTTGYGDGLNALIGTSKLGVTRQTYYSSPTMSLAQANIFNYMGYQTDGKKDVNTATNEYFRSIAYGIGTTWGNTRSSEAKRVQYWMTNADGSKLTAKGPTFQRLTYKGNTVSSTTFNNEVLSAWGEGNLNAHDYVAYNFGARSNISDGTSRGYKYNINKTSWTEKVNGTWRGKAAYDLPWAKGFIYDGVQKDGTVDASGYSVSRSYRNNIGGYTGNGTGLEGIVQSGIKGWQGKGMNVSTIGWKGGTSAVTTKNMTEAYEVVDGKTFTHEYYLGSSAVKIYQPAIRDWSKTRHIPYSDTRNLIEPGGVTMPGAEKGDVAPRDYMAKWWEDNAIKDDDRFAESQPYDHNDMLRAYTNTASDKGAKIRATNEFKLMQAKRDELVQATVISDALILDLPNGLQPIMYHYKNASLAGQAENRLPDTRSTFDELWRNNLFTPNSWADTPTGTAQDGIIIGGYNGDLSNARTTGNDVQKRLHWRTDEIPATPNMFIQTKTAVIEAPSGVIGSKMGAKLVNGTNINLYLAHNTTAPTRKLSLPVTNKASVGAPVQRTLLYNITPILLSADNREYNTGSAEAFWESIVQWKDSSNHDYYGPYIDGNRVTKADVYIATGKFIRLPELLGNYGQNQRSLIYEAIENEEDYDLMEVELAKYFKDSKGLTAYGAERARAAQLEQYHSGYGVTGYNYDTTNKKALDGKYHKNMYNESANLTGAAKGNPYVTDGKLGVPFILENIYTTTFKTDTAVRKLGATGAASIPKSGFIQQTAYTRGDGANDNYALNNVVIHNPVSARSVQIMPIASWRDQRTNGQSLVSAVRNQLRTGCPGTVELCEYSHLNCEYDKTMEILKLNLVGSGNAVLNSAAHAQTTGNVILAGNYALSSTGLSSNGSPRTGVSLSELGGRYYKALDYQVTAPITYSANTGEQMLFGFEGYGITLNTSTKKLAIRVSGTAGYLDVSGTFNSGDTLKVQFGSDNASLSKVWVNGSLRTVTIAGGATLDTMSVGKTQIGDTFYIGSWNSGTPAYLPKAGTKYTSVLLERLAGSHTHTLACMTTFTHHLGGNNAHIHTVDDLGPSDSTKYLNGTLQGWNKYVIDDATLRERLGDILWTALGLPKAQTVNIVDETISLSSAPVVNTFSTKGTHTYVVPHDGEYLLETWGAAGGGNTPRSITIEEQDTPKTVTGPIGSTGGKGGYSSGYITLKKGDIVTVTVGGQGTKSTTGTYGGGGFNGGGKGANGGFGGGGATDIRVNGTSLSNRVLVAGGGGGADKSFTSGLQTVTLTYTGLVGNAKTTGTRTSTVSVHTTEGINPDSAQNTTSSNNEIQSFATHIHTDACYAGNLHICEHTDCEYEGNVETEIVLTTSGSFKTGGNVWNYVQRRLYSKDNGVTWSSRSSSEGSIVEYTPKGYYLLNTYTWNYTDYYKHLHKYNTTTGTTSQISSSNFGSENVNVYVDKILYRNNKYFIIIDGKSIRYSNDGITFYGTSVSGLSGQDTISDIVYGNGMYVAAGTRRGSDNDSAVFFTSTDGVTWTLVSNFGLCSYGKLIFAKDRFIYGGGSGHSNYSGYLYYSYNGTNWISINQPRVSAHNCVAIKYMAYGNDTLVIVDAYGQVYSTTNFGQSYNLFTDRISSLKYCDGFFYMGRSMVTNYSRNGLLRSSDGITWSEIELPALSTNDYSENVLGITLNSIGDTGVIDRGPCIKQGKYYNAAGVEVQPICNTVVTSITATNPTQTVVVGGRIITTAMATYLDGHIGIVNCSSNYKTNVTIAGSTGDGSGGHGGGASGGKYYINGVLSGAQATQTNGPALGQGASATVMTNTGGAGGGYYGGYVSNQANGGGGGGSGYVGGVTSGITKSGERAGDGRAVITAPDIAPSKSYTFTVTGTPKHFDASAVRTSGSGNLQIELYRGSTADPTKLIDSVAGTPNATYSSPKVLSAGTYTVVVKPTDATSLGVRFKASLTGRNLQYTDIMALPNIGGAEAWRQIPYYLPNGNRNPVYSCNNELNTHICTPLCTTEVTYDKCTEPHHDAKGHYDNDSLCFTPCLDDRNHNLDLVNNSKVNTLAAEFVSIDWDYTLYADSIDTFRSNTSYQLTSTSENTGLGYYDTNINGEFDTIRFVRAKYVNFPWLTLYDGILYNPGEWIVLGDRGDYVKANVTRANNGTGLGGNVQSGIIGTADLWHGKQAAEYNVQNWSLYNQQSYKDLYKDFYDFYVPLANSEMSLGQATYATVAVNSRDTRESLIHAGQPRVLSETANINSWMQGNLVNNRVREMNMASIGAGKTFYVDVVGRIGGLVIEDTSDIKFSNTFKQPLAPVSESKTTYDIDMSDLSGTQSGRLTKALQLSESIITGGKILNALGTLPTRATLNTASDWVGFDYAGGNARKYIITVNGNNLKAGELTLGVSDTANGDYTLRLSDMTITRYTDQLISVEVDVKQTNAAVTVKPRFALIDTDIVNVYVSSMTVAIGGSGFSQGLNKTVDVTKQNHYITDLTDVRGIYLGATANTSSASEGHSTLAWSRYSNFAAVADWIRISNSTQVRDVSRMSQRATPEYGTRAVNTYGTRPWVQESDPLYKALAGSGGKALIGPLTSAHNTVAQHRNPEDQISVGSKIFFDITTLGNYSDMDSNLKIIPTYYLIDTSKRDETGAVALIPVDVYQFTSTGSYQPVNIFGAPYGGFTDTQIDAFNQYRLSLNWDEEAVAENNRRMVTNEEYQAVQTYSDLFTENLYDGDPYEFPGLDMDDPDTYPTPSGKTASPRQLPAGVMQIGGSQFVQQGYRTQTYIGSNFTYGVDKSGGLFAPFNSNPTQSPKYIYWQVSAQRWHSTLGLPSDAMFVPLAQDPVTHKFIHRDISEIPTHALDITKNLIIGYMDVYAEGRIWTLHYGNQGLQRTLTIGGVDYDLPIAGPVGPATANPYPEQTSVGTDYTNGGIPFGVIGGTRVEGQADIIKVN